MIQEEQPRKLSDQHKPLNKEKSAECKQTQKDVEIE